jgi:hypothetical protein
MTERTRTPEDGRYTYSKLDRVCTCGHTLGVHTAARSRGSQPCLAYDEGVAEEPCDCDCFTPARRTP